MKILKKIGYFVLVYFIVGFICTLSLIVTYELPNNKVKSNIEESIVSFEKKEDRQLEFENKDSTVMDNFTDAIILGELYYDDSSKTALEKSMSVYRNKIGDSPVQDLIEVAKNKKKATDSEYARYWHGNLVVLKPIFYFMDYSSFKIFNFIFEILLLIIIVKLMYKNNIEKYIIPMVLAFALINPVIISLSLQFSTIYNLVLIDIAILLKFKNYIFNKKLIPYYFMILGMLTSFFDFLTYPIVTLGVTMVFVIVLKGNSEIKKDIIDIIVYSILWALGYGIFWFSKWALASVILKKNVVKNALDAILFRTSIESYSRLDAIVKNLGVFNNFIYKTIIKLIIIYYFIRVIINRKNIEFSNIKKILSFGLISIMPIVWYFALSNHSYMHYWFTYRSLVVLFISVFFFLEYLLINKEKNILYIGGFKDEKRK